MLLAVHAKGCGAFNPKGRIPNGLVDLSRFLSEPRPPEFDCFFADFKETFEKLSAAPQSRPCIQERIAR
jgi:hypothetical protein